MVWTFGHKDQHIIFLEQDEIFVLCWLDEVCSEYNEVNEEAVSKRREQEC